MKNQPQDFAELRIVVVKREIQTPFEAFAYGFAEWLGRFGGIATVLGIFFTILHLATGE